MLLKKQLASCFNVSIAAFQLTMFVDHAENLAKKGNKMSMEDWHKKLDMFLEFNEYEILENYGKINKAATDSHAALEYKKFKPIQEANYMSDFDKAVETIRSTGALPKKDCTKLEKNISNFDKKLKQALDFNPKDESN